MYSLEHKEGYDIITDDERYIYVLQVPRDFLPCDVIIQYVLLVFHTMFFFFFFLKTKSERI